MTQDGTGAHVSPRERGGVLDAIERAREAQRRYDERPGTQLQLALDKTLHPCFTECDREAEHPKDATL